MFADLVAAYLTGCGFAILDRNWRCRLGELDIVARDGGALAAVEVKARSGTAYGHPFEAVTEAKLHRLLLLGRAWAGARAGTGPGAHRCHWNHRRWLGRPGP